MTDPRWRRGVSYARFSTDKQESTDEQHDINGELAQEHGIELLMTFTDEAAGRTKSNRAAFLSMLRYLEENPEVGWVVVGVSDRLTAGLRQAADWEEFAEKHDIGLMTKLGAILPLNGAHQVTAAQNAVAALAEVVKIRERTRTQLRSKVRNGTVAMRPAYGVRMKPVTLPDGTALPSGAIAVDAQGRRRRSGELEVHPDELPWLQMIFTWVGRDGASMEEVARRLNKAGVPTKSGAVGWRPNTVKGILTNPFYKGDLVWGAQKVVHTSLGKRLERRAPGDPGRLDLRSPLGALIDPELWQQVQDDLAGAAGARPHALRQKNPRRAFDGLVVCGDCGIPMYGGNTNKVRKDGTRSDIWRYVCYGPRPGSRQVQGYGPPCAVGHSLLETAIIDALERLISEPAHPDVMVRYAPRADVSAERRRVQEHIRRLEAQYERVRDMGKAGLYSVEEVVQAKEERDLALVAARVELEVSSALPATPSTMSVAASVATSGVIELLRARALPGEVLGAGLRDMGLSRVLVYGPQVEIEWRP